jgi:formate--tetrahydrofolate ligase
MAAYESDVDIAKRAVLHHITEVAAGLGLEPSDLILYGDHKAKIKMAAVRRLLSSERPDAPVILVSATSPTEAGEGKTTCTIGLAQALNLIGGKAIPTLREPSMGPVFGRKGGATGGGYAQVLPMEDINLHFTGDLHAIAAANNLVSAVLDNELYFGNPRKLALGSILWRRALDMNDRALRTISTGRGKHTRQSGFDISAASTMMAILCLSTSYAELKERIGRVVLGFTDDGKPFTGADLGVQGSSAALLRDALLPNLVQTSENGPAFVHGGPFANIAQGTASVLSMRLARKLANYVVTEAGFGFDLGGEKFLDLVGPMGGLMPSACVIVTTARSLKLHGGVHKTELNTPSVDALRAGACNLEKHLENARKLGLSPIVAINRFPADTDAEIAAIHDICERAGVEASTVEVRAKGGEGAVDLAKKVAASVDRRQEGRQLYDWSLDVETKIGTIAGEIYGAGRVEYAPEARDDLRLIQDHGFEALPICMAKTPVSFSDDPAALGRPEGFTLTVRRILVSSGGGFLIPLTGKILLMPGLPERPAALDIDIDDDGAISGLF